MRVVSAAGLLLAASGSALGHHGMASYDTSKLVTLKGTVTQFAFVNPHVEIHVQIRDGEKPQNWIAETNSPTILHRSGWYGTMLKPGDRVTAVGNPLRDGAHMLRLQKLILPDGREVDPNRSND